MFCQCFAAAASTLAENETDRIDSTLDITPAQIATPEGGDFSLLSSTGTVSLTDFKGSAVLLAFGFTHCPDVCPTTLSFLSSVLDSLDETAQAKTRSLFVTLDPIRDSVAKISDYAKYFHDNIIGLTGTEADISMVARQYGVRYATVTMENSNLNYTIDHSAAIYLINPDSELQFVFPYMTPASVLTESVLYVLTQSATNN